MTDQASGTLFSLNISKPKVYSGIFLVYLTQGLIYFTSLSALPAFFGLYPELFTITQQNIFILIAKSAPLVKIGYGTLMDRSLKQSSARKFNRNVIGFYAASLILILMLSFSIFNSAFFLFIFAVLFLLVAFFDACVDAIAVRFSAAESRIGLVSFMNISYSLGTMLASMVYLILPRTTTLQWLQLVITISFVGIVLLGALVALLILLTRGTAVAEAQELQIPLEPQPQGSAVEEVQLISGSVPKAEYKRISLFMIGLLFLANIDALVEITTEKWMVTKFGQSGFDLIIGFSFNAALPVKIVLLIILFVFRNQIIGKELKMLYVCLFLSFIHWVLIGVVDLQGVMVLILISQFVGVLLLVGMSGLMMRFVPKARAGSGYQVLTLWYNIPLMLLPPVGNSFYGVVGHEALFFGIALVILAVIFPLLRRFDSLCRTLHL